ncbi:MAG: PaaI family thioesterase [Actinomycetota bacterium]
MPDPSEGPEVRTVLERGAGPLMEKIGVEFLDVGPEKVTARIPVKGNEQYFGLLHGGANAALAETVASVGAWVRDPSKDVLGMELKVNHLKGASDGWVTATAVPLHAGQTTAVWEVRIRDGEGRLTAFATVTVAIRDRDAV